MAIKLFERSGRLGGRVRSVNVDDEVYETGGAILSSGNKYITSFVTEFSNFSILIPAMP